MTVWFTVQLADRPGSLARVATALAERNVNITGSSASQRTPMAR